MSEEGKFGFGLGSSISMFLIICIAVGLWGCPHYAVYQQNLSGQAKLAEAQSSREITVREAMAKKDAAKLLAEAEVERAKGVAEANKIIGHSLKDNEDYLRYLFVNSLEHTKNQIIYVPTETQLPILEAGRRAKVEEEEPK